ncbi:hypothetical protein A2U01_0026102, partial [Trifolium medium]|nr:hypothetical protein [Trifolium medium]
TKDQSVTINDDNGDKSNLAATEKLKNMSLEQTEAKVQQLQLKKVQQLWLHNDYLCKNNHIINGLEDDLYDYYSSYKSARDVWEALKKYNTEEVDV